MLRAPTLTVIGKSPEAIKQAPVLAALWSRGIAGTIVLTGQHPALDLADHGLGGYPIATLGCAPHADPLVYAAKVAEAISPL